jgi:hypothetical protein
MFHFILHGDPNKEKIWLKIKQNATNVKNEKYYHGK